MRQLRTKYECRNSKPHTVVIKTTEDERSEFYSFVRSLEALKASMQGENKTVILSSDSPIAQIFEGK